MARFTAHSPATLKGIKIDWSVPVELTAELRDAMRPNDVDTLRAGVLVRGYAVADVTYPRGTIAFRVAEAHEVFLLHPAADAPVAVAAPRIEPTWAVELDRGFERHRGTVGTDDDDERVDVIIAARAPNMSRARAQAMIDAGCVRVAGLVIRKPNHRPRTGDVIELVVAVPAP